MNTIARCPYRDGKIRLAEAPKAAYISCPRCRRAFTPTLASNDDDQRRNGLAAPGSKSSATAAPQAAGDDDQDRVEPDSQPSGSVAHTAAAWSSTVGAVGLTLAAFGFASASVLGIRSGPFVFGDASVHSIRVDIDPQILGFLANVADGNPVPSPDDLL